MTNAAAAYKDALSCPICMETLTTPKMLTCGHSFCLTPCLSEIVKQHEPMCPLCRTPIAFPPSGEIEDLPTNFSVAGLLDVLRETEDEKDISQAISNHTQKDGDYVCMTCLLQVCSCCQLSFHVDNNHDCTSVSEFREKLEQDVSKMLVLVNKSSWSQESYRYTTASLVMPTYLNLQENIDTSCKKIFEALCEEKLDLKKIKQLQKQVKKDHSKFAKTCEALSQEICEAKKQEDIKAQLAEYQEKLIKLRLSDSIYKKHTFRFKISHFENLEEKADALSKSLIQQLKTKPIDICAAEENLLDIDKNTEALEQSMNDITQDYQAFLLQNLGIRGTKFKSHHLSQIREAVEAMNFGSGRHSQDIMSECNELVRKFQASKHFIKMSFNNRFLSFQMTEGRFGKLLIELENCKGYYEDVYEVIGKRFVIREKSFMKECVKRYSFKLETCYVLQSTSKFRTPSLQKHLAEFERVKQTTKTQCKALMRYISQEDFETSVVHEKLKEIEIRSEKNRVLLSASEKAVGNGN